MPHFNPEDAAFLQNPYPTYQALLAESPIFHDGRMWFFTRHADVDSILRDRRFGRSILHVMSREELNMPMPNPAYEPFTKLGQHSMFDKEPPEHTRLRALVHKAFTPKRIRDLQPRIEMIADDLLDEVSHRGHFDLLA